MRNGSAPFPKKERTNSASILSVCECVRSILVAVTSSVRLNEFVLNSEVVFLQGNKPRLRANAIPRKLDGLAACLIKMLTRRSPVKGRCELS